MIKKVLINSLLILFFLFTALLTILPSLASVQFNKTALLESKYHWKDADKKFNLAMRLDPLNAEYHADIGRLYTQRTAILKDKIPVLLKTEEEYKKARELNPHSARYLMALAAVEGELFLADTAGYKDKLAKLKEAKLHSI